jgi:hypothetical protein
VVGISSHGHREVPDHVHYHYRGLSGISRCFASELEDRGKARATVARRLWVLTPAPGGELAQIQRIGVTGIAACSRFVASTSSDE